MHFSRVWHSSLHHRLRWVEPCWSIWRCFILRCASNFWNWIQISPPKIIFCIPNIHPPAEMPGLLVDVWSVTVAGQNHHLLPLDSEADFDPCQAPFSYLTLRCLIFNKSSSPKRRTYQIFYSVHTIGLLQRKNRVVFRWPYCTAFPIQNLLLALSLQKLSCDFLDVSLVELKSRIFESLFKAI